MIAETLKNAIRTLSKRYEFQPTELRIRISKSDDKLKYEIMKNSQVIEETNLATALNLGTITSFMVGNQLHKIIDNIAKDYGIAETKMNVRIYTKTEDCEPLLYLFDGGVAKTQLSLESFT